ncbi:YkvA family protein [Oceanospirillum beijerinckii]|uniref:YkvA family protein n=1 Tax=Oceanospirillum beijerinckii TaxID=64976 RepID=UPI0003FC0492|nr:YkvA family protein [Oceanospirillum beijerinckii]
MAQNKGDDKIYQLEQDNTFSAQYSDNSFWDKVKKYARSAGEEVLETALKLYFAATDPDTPTWARTTIFAALGYFIAPLDAIPDAIPAAGFSDDLGVLVAAAATVAANLKEEHSVKAKETLQKWFG